MSEEIKEKSNEMIDETVDNLKVFNKVIKQDGQYVHKIRVFYPKENVKNMIESWEKTVDELNEWLDGFDEKLQTTIEDGVNRLNDMKTKKLEGYAGFEKLTNDEKLNKLMTEYKKEKSEFLAKFEDMNKVEEDYKREATTEFQKYKAQALKDRENKTQALKLWKI
jgi:hypothetical protein